MKKCMRLFVALSFTVALFDFANAQTINIPVAKFSTENNIVFKEPSYDDASWQQIKTGLNWEPQGFTGYNGFAWYRIKTIIPNSMIQQAVLKDSIRIHFGGIDDCAEIFLNGKLKKKTGSFPNESAGYISTWSETVEVKLSVLDANILWDKQNTIAIKVYDGGGGGGLFKNEVFIKMVDVMDEVNLQIEPSKNEAAYISLLNNFKMPIKGLLTIAFEDNNEKPIGKPITQQMLLKPKEIIGYSIPQKLLNKVYRLKATFTETVANTSITKFYYVPYILTPLESPKPSINTPAEYGFRPTHPLLYKIPVSGKQPIQYTVSNLPNGLTINNATGIITGMVNEQGTYNVTIKATNAFGNAEKTLRLVCGDKIALTPPMGWNSWNCFGLSVNKKKVKATADAFMKNGLVNYGWNYINIDDGWEADKRQPNGELLGNAKFPDMKSLGDYIHSKGLKFGIYSSPGEKTCGNYLGSYGYELTDATSYANWGVDYLKYDWCSYGSVFANEKDTSLYAYKKPYVTMQQALAKQPRDMLYSLCQYGMRNVWEWGASVGGNVWRTTGDIEDSWESFAGIGFKQSFAQAYAKPGGWNDADMMVIGKVGWGDNLHYTRLTPDEQYTHVTLWALLNNPLLIGCDVANIDKFTLSLLTNKEVIAINQNTYSGPAKPVVANDCLQIWKKQITENTYALGIFNLANKTKAISTTFADLQLKNKQTIRDIWRNKTEATFENSYTATINAHGVKFVLVTEK
jgi:alpha-galactosidase